MKISVVGAHQAHEPALDFDAAGFENLRFIGVILRFEHDFIPGAAETF